MKNIFIFFIVTLYTSLSLSAKNFVLISAPGSGKGTFSQYLVENHDYVQICPGDLFRKEIELQTELGKNIQPIVDKGEYVDEHIVCTIIASHLLVAIQDKKNFIIDGFPRSIHSFEFLYKFLQDNNLIKDVVFLQFIANDGVCLKRIAERSVCTQCFRVYNATFYRPRVLSICNQCGTQLTKRKSDTIDIAQNRLMYFHSNIEPLMDLAKEYYKTQLIDTNISIEELREQYDELVV